jgi:hypothetical protein
MNSFSKKSVHEQNMRSLDACVCINSGAKLEAATASAMDSINAGIHA